MSQLKKSFANWNGKDAQGPLLVAQASDKEILSREPGFSEESVVARELTSNYRGTIYHCFWLKHRLRLFRYSSTK